MPALSGTTVRIRRTIRSGFSACRESNRRWGQYWGIIRSGRCRCCRDSEQTYRCDIHPKNWKSHSRGSPTKWCRKFHGSCPPPFVEDGFSIYITPYGFTSKFGGQVRAVRRPFLGLRATAACYAVLTLVSSSFALPKCEGLRRFRGGPCVNIRAFLNGCGVFPDLSPPIYHET
jgi:hypothetical protein